jgi:hypothetical protein
MWSSVSPLWHQNKGLQGITTSCKYYVWGSFSDTLPNRIAEYDLVKSVVEKVILDYNMISYKIGLPGQYIRLQSSDTLPNRIAEYDLVKSVVEKVILDYNMISYKIGLPGQYIRLQSSDTLPSIMAMYELGTSVVNKVTSLSNGRWVSEALTERDGLFVV